VRRGVDTPADIPANVIENNEMELKIVNVISEASGINGIYLLYGQKGIGKTVALKRSLSGRGDFKWDPPIHYVYVATGMKGLLKLLTPNKDGKQEAQHDMYKTITEALMQYSDYRDKKFERIY
jgi:hypothetical protein